MNLELVMQSEVSQKEKNKYCILAHIYGIQKDGAEVPACKAAKEMQMKEQTFELSRRRKGWDDLREQH